MKSDILKLFTLQRQLFGVCPECNDLFRLSDCKIYLKRKPTSDWMDGLDLNSERLERLSEKLDEKEEELRESARKKGRREAQRVIRRIDPVFTPRKLDPDDAKVIFHPIDYVVFNGMKKGTSMRNIVLLDRQEKGKSHRSLQRSIERVVESENYEWQTMRVQEDGKIKVDQ
jgi:predicted Holliday junction resolvase-like endonuclease